MQPPQTADDTGNAVASRPRYQYTQAGKIFPLDSAPCVFQDRRADVPPPKQQQISKPSMRSFPWRPCFRVNHRSVQSGGPMMWSSLPAKSTQGMIVFISDLFFSYRALAAETFMIDSWFFLL